MNKVRRKFVVLATVAVFVVLTALLTVINGINFTMVAEDADRVTEMISSGAGRFPNVNMPERGGFREPGKMGPDSPETAHSARYFTVKISQNGEAETVALNISAFTEEEAKDIAVSLMNEKRGWTNGIYRYRVYKEGGDTFVTVVDQGRELLPSYRILVISIIGEIICIALCLAFLIVMSKKIFKPIEEADRRQREFLAEAENEFKIPLTVIGLNTEVIEKTVGQSDETLSINRQVKKLISLTKKIPTLGITGTQDTVCDLTDVARDTINEYAQKFNERNIKLSCSVADGVTAKGNKEEYRAALGEILENSLKFAKTSATFTLSLTGDRTLIESTNDADLPDGSCDRVFDRFTRLENSSGVDGVGLGLSGVKDFARGMNGRVSASVEGGVFKLRVAL